MSNGVLFCGKFILNYISFYPPAETGYFLKYLLIFRTFCAIIILHENGLVAEIFHFDLQSQRQRKDTPILMNESNKPVFKTQLNGYNKQNVNQYILEMNSRFAEAENSYRAEAEKLKLDAQKAENEAAASVAEAGARITALESELEAATVKLKDAESATIEQSEKIDELSNSVKTAEADAASARARVAELEAELSGVSGKVADFDPLEADELREQLKAVSAQNDTLRRENAAMTQQLDELTRKLFEAESALSADEAAKKAELYDQMTSKLGSIMLNANTSAELLIGDAEKKAAAIIAEAERKAGELAVSAGVNALNAKEYINDEIRSSVHGCLDELMTEIDSLQYQLVSVLGNLGSRKTDIDSRLDYYKHSLTEAIEKKLAELK